MSTYFINGDTITGIADAVRYKTNTKNQMTPSQITQNIYNIRQGC